MNPLIGFALRQAKHDSMCDLERIGFEIDQNEQQAIFRRWERAIGIGRIASGYAGFAIQAPQSHMHLKGRFNRWYQQTKSSSVRLVISSTSVDLGSRSVKRK